MADTATKDLPGPSTKSYAAAAAAGLGGESRQNLNSFSIPPKRNCADVSSTAPRCNGPSSSAKKERRRPTVVRDFPPGCGRNATPLNPEDFRVRASPRLNPRTAENDSKMDVDMETVDGNRGMEKDSVLPAANVPGLSGAVMVDEEMQDVLTNYACDSPPSSNPSFCDGNFSVLPANEDSVPKNDQKICPAKGDPVPKDSQEISSEISPAKVDAPPVASLSPTASTYSRRRRVSATRDFPFGCGRGAPPMSREECLKAIAEGRSGDGSRKAKTLASSAKQNGEKRLLVTTHRIEYEGFTVKGVSMVEDQKPSSPSQNGVSKLSPPSQSKVSSESARMDIDTVGGIPSPNADCRAKTVGSGSLNTATEMKAKADSSPGRSIANNKRKAEAVARPESYKAKRLLASTSKTKSKETTSTIAEDGSGGQQSSMISSNSNIASASRNSSARKQPSAGIASSTNKSKLITVNSALKPEDKVATQDSSQGEPPVVTRAKVRETMRLFQALHRKFVQEDEKRKEDKKKGKKEDDEAYARPDIRASRVMKKSGKWINTGKQIEGQVPGVEVGDEFHYRIELCIIGLHRQTQSGIDYLKIGKNHTRCTSIVAQGGYPDDIDNGEVLIYNGQGGNNSLSDKNQAEDQAEDQEEEKGDTENQKRKRKGDKDNQNKKRKGDKKQSEKKKPEDQKLVRGNLALKNSMDDKTPVRVIRGFKQPKKGSDSEIKYTYDGLYLVKRYWQDKGSSGCMVYKFELERIPGQPELAWKIFRTGARSRGLPEGLRVQDISNGNEVRPIAVVNTVDDDPAPAAFEYTREMIYPSWYTPVPPQGCDCKDGCLDSENCSCAVKNGGEIPYNHNGAIVEAKPIVYECGPHCKCSPDCYNRVSQNGIKIPLEIFKTENRGWGVRAQCSIPSGTFICEYTGELISDMEAEKRTGNDEYLFDIGGSNNDNSLWNGLSELVNEPVSNAVAEVVEDAGFAIDAFKYGGIGRFINHSCSPNLYAQNVLFDHDDKKAPHVMLFAAENIPPLQELCYHYNYRLNTVRDSEGNVKKKDCYCGSEECSGRLY